MARRGEAAVLTVVTWASPVGPLQLCAEGDALVGLWLPDHPPVPGAAQASRVIARTIEQLTAYFAGERRAFDVPLAPHGTAFQQAVWRALLDIPYGATRSYGELARVIGRPTASRAVGAANGSNPISIIVPCHRVIGASGQLTGYGGGLPMKRWLLDHERGARAQLPLL